MRNTPNFDPLNATDAEQADMCKGYCDALIGVEPPRVTSFAYDYGRQNGICDRHNTSTPEQRALARCRIERDRARAA